MYLAYTTTTMSLSFLRPMALPRPATLQRFFGVSRLSTTAAAPATSTPHILPYNVLRTTSKQLPVYLLAKRGGNLKQTRLRKIEGDIGALRTELQDALGLEHKDVVVNALTMHIIIKVRLQEIKF